MTYGGGDVGKDMGELRCGVAIASNLGGRFSESLDESFVGDIGDVPLEWFVGVRGVSRTGERLLY